MGPKKKIADFFRVVGKKALKEASKFNFHLVKLGFYVSFLYYRHARLLYFLEIRQK